VIVYALVASRRVPASFSLPGGRRFHLVREAAIAAVVSDGPGPSPTAAGLRRYDHAMRELADRFSAILPVRFGTRMAEDELRFVLSSRRRVLARALAHVRRRSQMTVRIVRRQTAAAHGVEPDMPLPLTGRDYLQHRARAASAAQAVPGFEPVSHAVRRWVRDERIEHRGGVSSVYHLVPRSSADAYLLAARRSAAAAGLPAVVSGPWPPYAFATFG
jgi:hypothetical protein